MMTRNPPAAGGATTQGRVGSGRPWHLAMLKPKNDYRGNESKMPTSNGGGGGGYNNDGGDVRDENPLIAEARRLIQTDLAIDSPSMLSDDNFVWINPFVDEPVGKSDYVVAGRYFRLRSAFPDLDYRSYDFRVDVDDSFTIRCTCRVTGTMQGAFQTRNGILPPNGRIMVCPPEGISITFDPVTMKVTRLCTGFLLDRQVGNTGGLTGVQAASKIAGRPMATWKNLPADAAYEEVYKQRPSRLENPQRGGSSPFPERVMIQLARGVLTTNMGADDPSLLSDDEFFYVTPTTGPIPKADYLRHFADFELAGYEPNFSYIRVDPYEPERVWVDCSPKAAGFRGPPQVLSLSFDRNGCCSRITTSAVLDPSVGNAGGLGGPEGYKYAMAKASAFAAAAATATALPVPRAVPPPAVVNRPDSTVDPEKDEEETVLMRRETLSPPAKVRQSGWTEVKTPSRPNIPPPVEKMTIVQDEQRQKNESAQKNDNDKGRIMTEPFDSNPWKQVTESFTNLPSGTIALNKAPIKPSPKSPVLASPMAPNTVDDNKRPKPADVTSTKTAQARPESNKHEKQKTQMGNTGLSPDDFAKSIRIPDFGALFAQETAPKRPRKAGDGKDTTDKSVVKRLESLKDITASIRIVPEQISRSFSLMIDPKTQEEKKAAEARRQQATAKRAAALEAKSAQSLKHAQSSLKDAKLVIARKKPAVSDSARDDIVARMRKKREEERKNGLQKRPNNNGSSTSTTSSIFGSAGVAKSAAAAKPATKPIPRLANWQQNVDGSITGFISGTSLYRRDEKITTSPVKLGRIAPGNVVRTGSGSRYYLE